MDYDNKIFSNNLLYYMNKKGVDRYKLCSDLNLKYSTVTEWILGNRFPRIDKVEILSNYFGINKSDLIEDHRNKKEQTVENELDNVLFKMTKELSDEDKIVVLNVIKSINKKIDNNEKL